MIQQLGDAVILVPKESVWQTFLEGLDSFTPDMAATDLQAAQAALSEITGDNADEKLLDNVFSRFCLGK